MTLTLRVNRTARRLLDDLARPRGLTRAQVIRRAVLLLKYLDDATAQGREVLIRDPATERTERLLIGGGV